MSAGLAASVENLFHTSLDLQMQDPDFGLHLHIVFILCDSVCVQIFPFYDDVGFPDDVGGRESTCNTGDKGLILGSGRFPGGGHGSPRQYSCLENSMDGGAWWTTVQRAAEESDMTEVTKHA